MGFLLGKKCRCFFLIIFLCWPPIIQLFLRKLIISILDLKFLLRRIRAFQVCEAWHKGTMINETWGNNFSLCEIGGGCSFGILGINMPEFQIASNPEEIGEAFKLRYEVFVEEQKVPVDMEIDEFDDSAIHVIVKEGDKTVGTGRLVVEDDRGRIGRLAVKKDQRGKHIGDGMMSVLEEEAKKRELREVYLHAQVQALPFYEKRGYKPRGDVFDEAGIDHQEMYKEI